MQPGMPFGMRLPRLRGVEGTVIIMAPCRNSPAQRQTPGRRSRLVNKRAIVALVGLELNPGGLKIGHRLPGG
jgi:hypothetical protein